MSRYIRLFLLALFTFQIGFARYITIPFYRLAGTTELVVLGHIAEVREKTFILQIEDILAGSTSLPQIEIKKYTNWTCSARWQPYLVGQREIAFLEKPQSDSAEDVKSDFVLLGAGSEGEWQIIGDKVSAQGFRIPGTKSHSIGEHPGQLVSLTLMLDALRTYRSIFKVEVDREKGFWADPNIVQLVPKGMLNRFRKRSVIHKYLVSTTLRVANRSAHGV